MRFSPSRVSASVVKAGAAAIAAALIVVGGAVVPANAVVQYSISGHVDLGILGVPAGANQVWVYFAPPGSTASDFISARFTSTNAAGNYNITAVPEGDYSLWFRYTGDDQGFASKYWTNADSPANATYFHVGSDVTGKDAVLPAYPTISGVVSLGSAGNHPAGVTAHVMWERQTPWYWEQGPAAGVFTDANGAFSFPAAPGVYRIHVYANADYDFLYIQRPGSQNQADPNFITMGTTPLTGQNITLPLLASISGHVNLGRSSVSAGAGDVRVSWLNCAVQSCYYSSYDPFVLTDASGNFTIPRMGNATYTLTFIYVRDTAFQSYNQRPTATIANYANATVPSVTLMPTASVSGHVSLGSLGTPAGMGDVTVSAFRNINGQFWSVGVASTDASGDYTVAGLNEGTYKLRFHHNTPGAYSDLWWPSGPSERESSSFSASSTGLTGYDVTMQAGVTISGVLKTSAGVALPNFDVTAHRYAIGGSVELATHTVVSGSDGSFSLTGLPAGKYMVEARQGGFNPPIGQQWIGAEGYARSFDLSTAIPLAAGEQHAFGDVVLLRTASVFGQTYCSNCAAGTFSQLYFLSPTKGWVSAGSPGGSYITNYSLLPGTYQLKAGFSQDSPHASFVSEPFTLVEGEQVTRNIALTGGTLPVGRLVKSTAPGATTVYLVDGLTRLVPVPVTAAATDAGVPAAVIAVSPASLTDYSIASPMSNMVSCYGYLTYLAAGGKLWPIDPPLVTGVAKTELLSSTCQTMPTGDHWINGALFVKSSTSSTVYYITATGEKRQVSGRVSMGSLSYPYWPEVLQVTSSYLSSLPTGSPIPSHFGKRPLASEPPATASDATASSENTAALSTLTVEQRATCYTDYFQALGAGLFAPLTQTVTLDADCRRELAMDPVPAG